MKPLMVLGLVLIILGALALAYQGITYTTHEKIIDIGPLQASADIRKTLPLSPLLSGLVLGVGIVFVIIGRKK
jgi:hypothetical protein